MLTSSVRSFARLSKKATFINKPFSFKNKEAVDAILAKYPKDQPRSSIIPLLHLGQKENGGWISSGVIKAVSDITGAPIGRIQETATFYTMFRFAPPGEHVVEVCRGLSCHINGGSEIIKAIEKAAGGTFKEGKSRDGKFTLEQVECLGACANSPCMIVDEVYYQDLNKKTAAKIIKNLKKGRSNEEFKATKTPPPRPLQ